MNLPLNIRPPENCLYCQTKLVVRNSLPFCPNYNCERRLYGRIQKFVDVLDIKGVGVETLAQMVEFGFVQTPADLWELSEEDYCKLDGRGEKHYKKFQDGLKAKEEMSVPQFFAALEIEGIGTFENICRVPGLQTYDQIMDLYNTDPDKLQRLMVLAVRMSDEKAQAIREDFIQKMDDIIALRKKIRFKISGVKLTGKTFVITGSCEAQPRSKLESLIKENGGIVGGSLSSKTDYLITDDANSNSTKAKKARELKKPIITSHQFLQMLESTD